MGIIIAGVPKQQFTVDAVGRTPRVAVKVTLECDKPTAFFCQGIGVFESEDGFIGAHQAAMKAGWLERNDPAGRLWICPACSGKSAS